MSFRSRSLAVRSRIEVIQRVLSIVTDSVVVMAEARRFAGVLVGEEIGVHLNRGLPIALSGDAPLHFRCSQRYRLEPQPSGRLWDLVEVGYSYVVDDASGSELFAYHWDQTGASPVRYPHLHVDTVSRDVRPSSGKRRIHKLHFPTGHVALEDVIRMLITEFGVEPRRANWESVLAEPEA